MNHNLFGKLRRNARVGSEFACDWQASDVYSSIYNLGWSIQCLYKLASLV
jgi:hypothetical protein